MVGKMIRLSLVHSGYQSKVHICEVALSSGIYTESIHHDTIILLILLYESFTMK